MKRTLIFVLVTTLIFSICISDVSATGITLTGTNMYIGSGESNSVLVREDGTVYTWARNNEGQLCDTTSGVNSTATMLSNVSGIVSVASGEGHVLALKSNGKVVSWGRNFHGQLGNGYSGYGTSQNTPQSVITSADAELENIVQVVAGGNFSLALSNTGTVYSWGHNNSGQIGIQSLSSSTLVSKATLVTNLTGVVMLAAGYSHAFALKSDGTLWAWGANTSAQLGLGNSVNKLIPTLVANFTPNRIAKIVGGYDHSTAVDSKGNVYSWGSNASGQLGDGTATTRNTPVAVSSISDVVSITAGTGFSIAVKSDGSLWGWGSNLYGRAGLGATTTSSNTPSQILSITNVAQVSAGPTHVLAVKNDGTIWAWGQNIYSQLGSSSGVQTYSVTPLQLDSMNWAKLKVSIGKKNSLASSSVTVPVDVEFGGKIQAFQLKIKYNIAQLSINNAAVTKGSLISANANWAITANVDAVNGYVNVVGYSTEAIIPNLADGTLVDLAFTTLVVANNTVSALTMENYLFSDYTGKTYSTAPTDGSITINEVLRGDINADADVTVLDVVLIINIIVGNNLAPTALQLFAADIDESGGAAPAISDIDVRDLVKMVALI